jgi:hypothetical protein
MKQFVVSTTHHKLCCCYISVRIGTRGAFMWWQRNGKVLSHDDPSSDWETNCEHVTVHSKVDVVRCSVMPLTVTLRERVAEYLMMSPANHLKPIVHLSYMYKFRSYLTENTVPPIQRPATWCIRVMVTVYCENCTKCINTWRWQNSEFLNVKACCTYGIHLAL